MQAGGFSAARMILLLFVSKFCIVRPEQCGVSFVVIGSTGDLAKRYLWPAIFQEFQRTECAGGSSSASPTKCRLVVAGSVRRDDGGAREDWWLKLLEAVKCKSVSCEICLHKFASVSIKYVSSTNDLESLASQLSASHGNISLAAHDGLDHSEVGRIFYLATPPSAYLSLVQEIDRHGRLENQGWLRVVLEKPFGSDLSSAEDLTMSLSRYLDPKEMLLVDHYLGKAGVENILPFRLRNADVLQPLWNHNNIQYVEVNVKERLGIQGRASFFDKYGIIRDMHQNHLMEMLVRAMMDTGALNETNFLEVKREFLSRLLPPSTSSSVLGQYEGYQKHLEDDGFSGPPSSTPTFATVVLYLQDHTWTNVPLFLTAGKSLDERSAYIKVVFNKMTFSVVKETRDCPSEITFLIQDEGINTPGILVSPSLRNLQYGGVKPRLMERGNCLYNFIPLECESHCDNAYVSVVANVLSHKQDQFVDVQSLLLSWKVWDLFLYELKQSPSLIKYKSQSLSALDFVMTNRRLEPVNRSGVAVEDPCEDGSDVKIRGLETVISHRYKLARCLLKRIQDEASTAANANQNYHLALPGGNSLKPLLDLLCQTSHQSVLWEIVHVWQTDERCVPVNHSSSNWHQLQMELLSHVPTAHSHHLHNMPVELHSGLCSESDAGADLYEKQIKEATGTGCMDHIILGVGRDGHVASLFNTRDVARVTTSKEGKVLLVERQTRDRRMSLTLDMILCSRTVSVFVSGNGKVGIWRALSMDTRNLEIDNTPVLTLLRLAASREVKIYLYIDQSQAEDFEIVEDQRFPAT